MKPVASFARHAALSALSAIIGRALSLLGMVATMRIFPTDTFGAWILILTFSGFFLPLTTLRLDIPFVMASTQRMAVGLFDVMAMSLLTVLAALVTFAVFASPTLVESATGLSPQQSTLVYLSLPTLLLLFARLLTQSFLMRTKHFGSIALINLTTPLLSLVLTISLPLVFPVTPQLAALIFLLSTGLGLVFVAPNYSGKPQNRVNCFSRLAMTRYALRRYSVYPKFTLPLSLSASLTERVIQLVLAQTYSLGTLASYFMARQILSGMTSVVGSSLRNVFFAHSARDRSIAVTRGRALRMLKSLTYLLAPSLAFSVFRIEDVVTLVAGTKWPSLASMTWFCMFPAAFLLFTGPLDRVFDLVGRQRLSVALQLTSDATMLLLIAVALYCAASANTLVGLISAFVVFYNAIWLCFAMKVLTITLRQIAEFFLRFAMIFAASVSIQWFMVSIQPEPLSWVISLLFLGLSTSPGIADFLTSLPAVRSRVASPLLNILQRLP